MDKRQLKTFNEKYPFSKEFKIKELINKIDDYLVVDKESGWESTKQKFYERKDKPVVLLRKKPWYKYVAAAIFIGILGTTYFLKDNILNTSVETTPVIVNTNIIEAGTDKATLTLADGSVVVLENGNSYQTQTTNSNGQQIVYRAVKEKSSEIKYNYLTIPRGGEFFIVLSDGTQIWLNSESQLKYPVNFIEGVTREVELVYGEAYFDVSPSSEHGGSKFKVLNNVQEVEVLGTEFNVKAYKEENNIYTTLVEGKVTVNNGMSIRNLKPRQQSNFNTINNNIEITEVDVYEQISWKEGVFSFDNKPLKEIMKVLTRWYDFDVVFENKLVEDVEFIGVLDRSHSIEELLMTIKDYKIIENYEINGKTITIK